MQAIPQRAIDLQLIDCIQGYKSNLHNAGRLLRQVLRAKLSFPFSYLLFDDSLIVQWF